MRLDKSNEYVFFVDNETASQHKLPDTVRTVVAQTRVSPVRAAAAGGNRSIGDIWSMSRSVMRCPVDVFFFPTMYSYFPIFRRTKIVVTLHDLIADNYPQLTFPNARSHFFWRLKQRVAILQASVIATVSNYSRSQIMSRFRLPETRLRVISEAAQPIFCVGEDGDGRQAVLSRLGLRSGDEFLLYVGGISPHKNLSTLVEAFHQIRSESERSIRLVLVGDYKDDPFLSAYPSLQEQIAQLGLRDSVMFTGFVTDEDLVHLYNSAIALVLPSFDEGFGLPAIEAMSCGTPVAASDCGSLPEVLGEAGTYFNPHSARDIASVVGELLNDEGRRQRVRSLGIERSRQFRWERAAEETLSIFRELHG